MDVLRRCRARIKHFGDNQEEMDRKYVTLVRKEQVNESMQSQRRKVMEFIREGDKEKLEEYLKVDLIKQNLYRQSLQVKVSILSICIPFSNAL